MHFFKCFILHFAYFTNACCSTTPLGFSTLISFLFLTHKDFFDVFWSQLLFSLVRLLKIIRLTTKSKLFWKYLDAVKYYWIRNNVITNIKKILKIEQPSNYQKFLNKLKRNQSWWVIKVQTFEWRKNRKKSLILIVGVLKREWEWERVRERETKDNKRERKNLSVLF